MNMTKAESQLGLLLRVWAVLFFAGLLICILALVITPLRYDPIHKPFVESIAAFLAALFFLAEIASRGIRRHRALIELVKLISITAAILFFLFYLRGERDALAKSLLLYSATGSALIFIITTAAYVRAIKARYDLKYLSAGQALALRALADVTIVGGECREVSSDEIVKLADRYLSSFNSSRRLSVKIDMVLLEYFPLIFLSVPLSWMGKEERLTFIKKRFFKSKGILRDLIRGAKQIIYLVYYGDDRTFPLVGYTPFEERQSFSGVVPKASPRLNTAIQTQNGREIDTDICIIGSGAAGAVLACSLAQKTGRKVTVLERGRHYVPERDFTNREPGMIAKLYTDGGLQLSQDFDLAILQGSCVGGTTVVNNGICFRAPEPVLDQWQQLGAGLDRERLRRSYERVESDIGVSPLDRTRISKGSFKFVEGCEKLKLDAKYFQTNFKDCLGSGYCNIGCAYNRKLSMLLNYLPWAVEAGAEIFADCTALKIETTGSKAKRVLCKRGNGERFSVNAKTIVISGGTIASSALLLRSGIRKNVGTRVSFNITTPMHAEFDEKLDTFEGVQMCCYLEGHGFLLETTFNPPGASALIMPGWFEEHFARMRRYPYLATAAPVVGTMPNGSIKIRLLDRFLGQAGVDYVIDSADFATLKEGMKLLSRVFLEAGARCVLPSTFEALEIRSGADLAKIDSQIQQPEDVALTSAHPQGGNPMTDDPGIGAVDTSFRVHGYDNLYVCDASVFPTSIKVNPQLTVMALAGYAAELIA
jgi:choline dehydrogenase-like flavoprotein